MKSRVNLILLLAIPMLAFFGGCKKLNSAFEKPTMRTPDTPYAKVYVSKLGRVTLDGKDVTLEELDRGLGALAQKNGVVLYSREAPEEEEPHPVFRSVIDIVAKNELPIRLCVTSDCSEALTPDGKLRVDD